MNIEQGSFFPHAFWIGSVQTHEHEVVTEIHDWCKENCSEQWILINTSQSHNNTGYSNLNITFNTPVTETPPIPGDVYPPSIIRRFPSHIILFESESDAAAFKLRWKEEK